MTHFSGRAVWFATVAMRLPIYAASFLHAVTITYGLLLIENCSGGYILPALQDLRKTYR
jgi:hypothetical protein